MPREPTVTDIRVNNIVACLNPAVPLLKEISDAFGTPFIPAIASTTLSLITAVQNAKHNKEECAQLMEDVHGLLYAIVELHIKSDASSDLPLATLKQIGNFAETLHKAHVYVESQQDSSKIKHFFRQSEMRALLKDCRAGLQQALDAFKVESGTGIFTDIIKMQRETQRMNDELVELIYSLSDTTTSDKSSSIYDKLFSSQNSSKSFAMLPAKPRIFHGRDSELQEVVKALTQGPARIAILGAGGMGKTTLATTILHHSSVAAKYSDRLFVACDSATTSVEVAARIGAHLGFKPGRDLTKPVVQYFSSGQPCLLILDNLETPWEPIESRAGVEEFLSLLTDVPHLALIITMRGVERPSKVRWSRPFLPPLNPLSNDAARQTFIDIADDFHDSTDIDKLLLLTDNLPLAVDLMAHLVDDEGCPNILARWETEKIFLLSQGYDQRSNLAASIALSLSSPRITSLPGAKDLLSLLSILPDGLADAELQGDLLVPDVQKCRTALLRTALAYTDDKERLKTLVPIREYIQQVNPPSQKLVQPLRNHFHLLLDFYNKYHGSSASVKLVGSVISNLGNIQSVLLLGLQKDSPGIEEIIQCTISFIRFNRLTARDYTHLLDLVQTVLPREPQLEIMFATEIFMSWAAHKISDPENMRERVIVSFDDSVDLVLQIKFYIAVGMYYSDRENNISQAIQYLTKALSLAKSTSDIDQQSGILGLMAAIKCRMGEYVSAQTHAREAQKFAELSVNLYQEARALHIDALASMALGDYKASISLDKRARELLDLCGLSGGGMDLSIMFAQAEVHQLKSEYEEAYQIYTQILKSITPEQDLHIESSCYLNIAQVDVMMGTNKDSIVENLEKAKRMSITMGNHRQLPYCTMMLADLKLREGETEAATGLFHQCVNLPRRENTEIISYCLERLGDVSRWNEVDQGWSSAWAVVYLGHSYRLKAELAIYKAFRCLGDVSLLQGDEDTAFSLFTVALDGFTRMDVHRGRADCIVRLGDISRQRGDLKKASELWTQAQPLFKQSLQAKDAARIESRIAAVNQDIADTDEEAVPIFGILAAPTPALDEKDDTKNDVVDKKKKAGLSFM
ncbi:hypothetical protein FB451DRAFT_1447390 [Mycena latifolia]|nr:hypothetical protein FB451DRAFT_1447390 [Mycena latifolia]